MADSERSFIPGGALTRKSRSSEPSVRAAGVKLLESHVQQTVREFLELDGWRAIRTDPVSDRARGKGFGEVGMPDYLFARYRRHELDGKFHLDIGQIAELLWVEFKAPGRKATAHQLAWHAAERARGALVLVVDDIEAFREWYGKSGLQRKR